MKQTYEALFTPWKIGNVEIKNRIVLCPMGGTSLFGWMEPNHFDKEAAAFFLELHPDHTVVTASQPDETLRAIGTSMGTRWYSSVGQTVRFTSDGETLTALTPAA